MPWLDDDASSRAHRMPLMDAFSQTPPQLANQYDDDALLRSYLARTLSADMLAQIEPGLREMGELAGGPLYGFQLADRASLPVHTPWDAWGNRIDRIEVSPLWRTAEQLAARHGLIATAYERAHGEFSRIHQFALVYLFTPSSDLYSCPLAMTDGAARTLQLSGRQDLIERAVTRLTSRDPRQFWTSGQWMTESAGGSDVGLSRTQARQDADGQWRLYGRKWFTSAIGSQMALTLARPQGNPEGGRGLALFYLETHGADGRLNGITVDRLKDKLGTRKVPTAELTLDGTRAVPVYGLTDGVRNIAPMLNVTRAWNSVSAVSYMRRALALAQDYARRRIAFGAPLADKPVHADTLSGMQAEFEAAFHLAFYVAELLGREEAGVASTDENVLLRLLTPIVKATTAKQCVAMVSEALECFGGAGYVEDTGLPALLRDAQVFPIWEGTTNVLSLDALRVAAGGDAMQALLRLQDGLRAGASEPRLLSAAEHVRKSMERARDWMSNATGSAMEAGARRFALTVGRTLALALLVRHAQWSLGVAHDARAVDVALRFERHGVDLLLQDWTD
jgi:alkylation response protein AidB-like acyl-CoA dehydrogenase